MQTRQLGNSDMHITAFGVGAWAMGGPWQFGWGPQDDELSVATIRRALELGVNWIDTAAIYGLGHSEEVVGRVLRGLTHRPYVFTKCGQVWDAQRNTGRSLKADSIRREIEASLLRLGVDAIDLMQIHWPDPDDEIEEGWTELAKLKDEGKIRWIGVSNFSVAQMERISKIAPITSLQPPYSLLKRAIEDDILPYCERHNIGVIPYSPMQAGLLTGKMTHDRVANLAPDDWRRRNPFFQEPQLTRNLAIANKLGEIAARHGRIAGEAALAWVLRLPVVTAAIVGLRSPQQADELLGAMDFRLSDAEIAEIEAFVSASTPA